MDGRWWQINSEEFLLESLQWLWESYWYILIYFVSDKNSKKLQRETASHISVSAVGFWFSLRLTVAYYRSRPRPIASNSQVGLANCRNVEKYRVRNPRHTLYLKAVISTATSFASTFAQKFIWLAQAPQDSRAIAGPGEPFAQSPMTTSVRIPTETSLLKHSTLFYFYYRRAVRTFTYRPSAAAFCHFCQ